MIKIRTTQKKEEPYYSLTLTYSLGKRSLTSLENMRFKIEDGDSIEKFCKILDKLTPIKTRNYEGIVLGEDVVPGMRRWENLTEEECLIWDILVFGYTPIDDILSEKETDLVHSLKKKFEKQSAKFYELVKDQDGDQYYFYKRYSLFYIDEYGMSHETYFED